MSASHAAAEPFRDLLARDAGLRFDDDKLPMLAKLLESRMQETGTREAATYLSEVAPTKEELAALAPTLTVSETYFLRNRDQFRALEALLRAREASPTRHLRMLSAGCSSGEEAYSLAITARETLQNPSEWTLSIKAVDLNPQVIDKARARRYTRWSLRDTPDAIVDKYFRRDGSGYAIADDIATMVRIEQQNLLHPSPDFWRSEAFDIVFCRNVLMYLTPHAAGEVVANIARSLAPGGHLFVGHAETLRGLSMSFHLRHTHDTFYYQRRDALDAAPESPAPLEPIAALDLSWFEIIGEASRRIERLSHESAQSSDRSEATAPRPRQIRHDLAPALALMEREHYQDALSLLACAPADAATAPDAMLLRAMLLVNTGEIEAPQRVCRELLAADELNAGAHYIMAICREHVGDRAAALDHSHAAAYLDAAFAMPHLQLGRLARRTGDRVTARRELALALDLLPREDAARIILFGGGFGRDVLVRLCRAELDACEVAR